MVSAVGRPGRQAVGHRRRGNHPTGQPDVELPHPLADLPRRDKPAKVHLLIVMLATKVYLVHLKLLDLVAGPGLATADVDHADRDGGKRRYDQRNPHMVTFLPAECQMPNAECQMPNAKCQMPRWAFQLDIEHYAVLCTANVIFLCVLTRFSLAEGAKVAEKKR